MNAAVPWALELRNFAKDYPSGWMGARTPAVRALSLRLSPGQVLGLFGPNGSGKSTTLKALAGLLAPTAGEVLIFGHTAGSDEAREQVGYLPELPRYSAHQTGREFLAYCAGLSSLGPAAPARIVEVLAWSGLEAVADRKVAGYSKGLAQRLGLAQAVLHDPALVLLDEPASGLDPEGRVALGALIRGLAARGKAVVFSSHLLAQAEGWCDRVALLDGGRLLVEGTPVDLLGATAEGARPVSRLEQLYLDKRHG